MADSPGRPWSPAPGAAYEVAEFEGRGRGLRAARPLEAGEVLLAVPVAECWPDAARAREALLGAGAPGEDVDSLSDEALVGLWLCRELQLGAASPLAGHFAVLPRELDTVLQWTEEEAEWLRGSCFCEAAMGLREESDGEWELLRSDRQWLSWTSESCPTLNRELFLWAKGAVLSRQLDLGEFLPEGAKTVVPGFDLLNHDSEWRPSCEVDVVGAAEGAEPCVVVRCARDVAVGEELLISYGPLNNASLLISHGFVVPGNPFDCMEFVLTFAVPPARRPWLQAIADAAAAAAEAEDHGRLPAFEVVGGDLGDPDPAAELVMRHNLYRSEPLPPSLLALLRLRALPDADLAALGAAASARAGEGILGPPGALAAASEQAAVRQARGILRGLAEANAAAPGDAEAARAAGQRAGMAAAVRAAEADLLAAAVASLGAP